MVFASNGDGEDKRKPSFAGGGEAEAGKNATVALPLDWTQVGQAEPGERKPADQVRYPSDVAELDETDTEIILVGTAGKKITKIGKDFYKTVNPALEQLVFRSHLIREMEGLEGFEKLTLLELYDNQIDELKCLADGKDGSPGRTIVTLDMSYNVIREMSPVEFCPNLQELYLANNKLKTIEGLKGLKHLRKIDLGANRIRVMNAEELAGLVNLEELWLGKNKIEEIRGLEPLTKLRRLDVQSNRLKKIEGLSTQRETLEELYLAHNGIDNEGASSETGLALQFTQLSVLDLSRNRLTNTSSFQHLTCLEELWISGNKIASFDDVQTLANLGKTLETVYLEYNPLQEDPFYRKKLVELIPSLKQIDANLVGGLATENTSSANNNNVEVARKLQEMAIARAAAETQQKKTGNDDNN